MNFALEDDRFDISYNPRQTTSASLLETIRQLGYEPEIVETTSGAVRAATDRIDLERLPPRMADTFARARRSKKPILVRFEGPG